MTRSGLPGRPFVLVSYRQESDEHCRQVSELVAFLRNRDLRIAFDEDHELQGPPEGWLLWMQHAVEWADALIVIWSSGYRSSWDDAAPFTAGRGVTWESQMLRARFYKAEDRRRLISVVLQESDLACVPDFLRCDRPVHVYPEARESIADRVTRWTSGVAGVQAGKGLEPTRPPWGAPGVVPSAIGREEEAIRVALQMFVAQRSEGFVGRKYVFEAINRFMQGSTSGYFRLQGDPGMGKSALMAELVRRFGWAASLRLHVQGFRDVLRSLGVQLVGRYGLHPEFLRPRDELDGTSFVNLLLEARRSAGVTDRVVIAIDALDEIDPLVPSAGRNAVDLPRSLPDNVFVVLSHRDMKVPLRAECPSALLDLMSFPDENLKDAGDFVLAATRDAVIAQILKQEGMSPDRLVSALLERSAGNFMYLTYVLNDFKNRQRMPTEEMPAGLIGYYEDHFSRMERARPEIWRDGLRIIYVLSELRFPVTLPQLAQLSNSASIATAEALNDWRQFLHRVPTRDGAAYEVYHRSFQEFLARQDIVEAAGLSLKDVRRSIARSLAAAEDDLLEPL